jgi:hypothetical protein
MNIKNIIFGLFIIIANINSMDFFKKAATATFNTLIVSHKKLMV